MQKFCAVLFVICFGCSAWAAHPFQVEDMQKFSRLGDPQISPDGKWIAFVVQKSNVEKNKSFTNLWIMPATGGEARQLTFAEKGTNVRPRWSPDSRRIYFLSDRTDDTMQVFRLQLAGGEAQQVSNVSIGVDSYLLSPDGKTLVFSSTVIPECADVACNEKKKKEQDDNVVKVRVMTEMPFRRWDYWIEGKRSHLFTMSADGGEAKDLTPGDIDSPIWTEGGSEEVAISPDSKEIAFSRYTENEALTGNSDLFVMPITGGAPKQITDNKAGDTTPLYSPDGRLIAYAAYLLPGLETDLTHLFVYDRKTGQRTEVAGALDRSAQSFSWTSDSKSLWITAEDSGEVPIYKLDIATKRLTKVYSTGYTAELQNTNQFLILSHMDIAHPTELFRLDLMKPGAKPTQITHFNDDLLKDIQMGEYSSFNYTGWNNETVQAWLIKPPAFDPSKRYPVLLFMHGGPENGWDNLFHYRWNPELFAAAGYVVIEPNFHGSSGFGLKFMHSIQGQWGGAPYEDQMKAVDVALSWSFTDNTRLAAAGASFGGYMANWIEGHTDRFRAIVSHDGLYDLHTALYAADFVGGLDKEFKGTPWNNPQALIDNAPATYAKNFKTPMLVIHGDKDYRVDPSNALAMFQVLQAMHVPSKLLYFKEENHWVLKPADNIFWYHSVLDWLDQWIKPEQDEYQKMIKTQG